DRKPKYIVAVACSSLYGDYFTGGQGSVMYVDEWEFMYK
ncbi:MAG: PCMD domain-containing protein, partial [Bacteroidales bacterium]|nr:PCMD domain-containing protein [Bacteroidales bacterium]